MSRTIRRGYAFFIQGSAKYLHTFQYHLADMLVAMVLSAGFDGLVEYENIHTLYTQLSA